MTTKIIFICIQSSEKTENPRLWINKTPKPLRKAGAILVTKDKFFIFVQNRYQTNQCNGKGSIGIPKGSMKSFESYQDCAIREVKEELGIKISITDKNKTRRISSK